MTGVTAVDQSVGNLTILKVASLSILTFLASLLEQYWKVVYRFVCILLCRSKKKNEYTVTFHFVARQQVIYIGVPLGCSSHETISVLVSRTRL